MTDTGGIQVNIKSDEHLTQDEDRTLRHVVKDVAGADISSFSGWTFGWYLARTQRKARPRYAGTDDVLIAKTDGGGGITSSAPDVDITIDPADTTDLAAGGYFYGLWRTDTNDEIRLAYGSLTLID